MLVALGEQLGELLLGVGLGRRRVEDQALLRVLLGAEDRMLEDELAGGRMLNGLAPDAAGRHLVQVPPLAELRASLLQGRDQILEVGVPDVPSGLGPEARDDPASPLLPVGVELASGGI